MKIKNNAIYIGYLVVVVLQVLVFIYWGNVKTDYYVDEIYSLQCAANITNPQYGDLRIMYFDSSDDFKFDTWIKASTLKDYFVVKESEEITKVSFIDGIKCLAKNGVQFGLFNLAYSLEKGENAEKWPGIIVNIIEIILAEIALIIIFKKMNVDKWISLLGLAQFGFSGWVLGIIVYIRAYALLTLIGVMFILLNIMIWKESKIWQILLSEIACFALIMIAKQTSPWPFLFAGLWIVFFTIASVFVKKWKAVISYSVFIVAGIMYVKLRTNYFDMVWGLVSNVEDIANNSLGMLQQWADSIKSMTYEQFMSNAGWQHRMYGNYYFGNTYLQPMMEILLIFLLITGLVSKFIDKEKDIKESLKEDKEKLACMIVMIATFFGYNFVLLMLGVYTLIYYIFSTVLISVGFWVILDYFIKSKQLAKSTKMAVYIILSILVMIIAYLPYKTRNVEHIYEEHHDLVENLKNYEGIDIVVAYADEDAYSNWEQIHTIYQVVNLADSKANIIFANTNTFNAEECGLPDKFIYWCHPKYDTDAVMEQVREREYQWEWIGNTDKSAVNLMYK